MLMDTYFDTIDKLYAKIRSTQCKAIEAAAKMLVEAVEQGAAVHVYDTGHIINSELIERGGGLMLLKKLQFGLHVESGARARDKSGADTSMDGLARYALKQGNVLPGDVLILGSVSGKSAGIIDLAVEAKKMGLKTIVLTSMEYTTQVASEHSTGKMLYEYGDVVLDNCAPIGDAMIAVEGLEPKICAGSGLGGAYIMWALTARVIELLLADGRSPSVFKSFNEGGGGYNENLRRIYAETGI